MSYEDAEKPARSAARSLGEPGNIPPQPVTPEWYKRPDMRPVLAARDVRALYRALNKAGLTQRKMARQVAGGGFRGRGG